MKSFDQFPDFRDSPLKPSAKKLPTDLVIIKPSQSETRDFELSGQGSDVIKL